MYRVENGNLAILKQFNQMCVCDGK